MNTDAKTGTPVGKNSDAIQKALKAIAEDLEGEDDDDDEEGDINEVDVSEVGVARSFREPPSKADADRRLSHKWRRTKHPPKSRKHH